MTFVMKGRPFSSLYESLLTVSEWEEMQFEITVMSIINY